MNRIFLTALLAVYFLSVAVAQNSVRKFTISGHLTDSITTETLIGATVYNRSNLSGTGANQYGFYSLTLPAGKVDLLYSYVGYTPQTRSFTLSRDTIIDIRLQGSLMLEEVEITADKSSRSHESTQMSAIHVPMAQMKAVPAFLLFSAQGHPFFIFWQPIGQPYRRVGVVRCPYSRF